jgi:hypothetical protein
MESRLETNGNQKYLVVYYDRQLKDWDRAIDLAMNRHKIKEPITVLAIPRREENK